MMQQQAGAGLQFPIPVTLLDAMSEIQQYYVVEKSGQPLDKEIFTPNHAKAFIWVGFHSALTDSLVWVFLYVLIGAGVFYVQENFLTDRVTQIFVWTVGGSPIYWFIKLASFGGLLFSTTFCVKISKFYTGTIPKRAINTLFMTRGMFLCSFSFLTFWLFGLLYKYLVNQQTIAAIYNIISRINPQQAEKVYYFLHNYLRRALFDASITVMLASAISIILPIIAVGVYRMRRERERGLGLESL